MSKNNNRIENIYTCLSINRDECPKVALNNIDWEIINQNGIFTQYLLFLYSMSIWARRKRRAIGNKKSYILSCFYTLTYGNDMSIAMSYFTCKKNILKYTISSQIMVRKTLTIVNIHSLNL